MRSEEPGDAGHDGPPARAEDPDAQTAGADAAAVEPGSPSQRPDDGTAPFRHVPVLLGTVLELLAPVPAGVVVDATVGGGGHARALLEANPHLSVLGLDRDPSALAASREALAPYGDRVELRRSRFDRIDATVRAAGHPAVSGVLFDLGVSSPQFDRPERGFSYRGAGPLDMRMDPDAPTTAADLVNGLPERELAALLRRGADERFANRIARDVVAARPVRTTAELADIVRDAIPAPARRRGGHPARRTFQALRVAVNEELEQLPVALDAAIGLLAPAGRCIAISYQSGEDRIVKARFRQAATGGCTCPASMPCGCGRRQLATVRLLRPGSWKPSAAEVAANPRAESARLRAVERLPREVAA